MTASKRVQEDYRVGAWRWLGQIVSEGFCWAIIAAPFVYLEYLSLWKAVSVTGMELTLAILAVSPWMVRLFARYLTEFNIGPSGISGKVRETVANRAEIDPVVPPHGAPPAQHSIAANPATNRFQELLPQTKKVLRTLWKFQVEHFGPDDVRRWGFTVSPNAPEYHEFRLGVWELIKNRLGAANPNGFIFLTNEGIEFCREHNVDVTAYPDFYQKFSA